MAWVAAFAAHEALARERVQRATWGHLAPFSRQTYSGWILFTLSVYGDITVIDTEFEGLPDSPWFFADMQEHVGKLVDTRCKHSGGIWRWEGTYTRFKNETCRFSGKVRPQRVSDRFRLARSERAKPRPKVAAQSQSS